MVVLVVVTKDAPSLGRSGVWEKTARFLLVVVGIIAQGAAEPSACRVLAEWVGILLLLIAAENAVVLILVLVLLTKKTSTGSKPGVRCATTAKGVASSITRGE